MKRSVLVGRLVFGGIWYLLLGLVFSAVINGGWPRDIEGNPAGFVLWFLGPALFWPVVLIGLLLSRLTHHG